MGRDVRSGKIGGDEGLGGAGERDGHEYELSPRRRAREGHPRGVATRRADEGQRSLSKRDAKGQHERKLTDLGDHRFRSSWFVPFTISVRPLSRFVSRASLSASAASGGI